MFALPQPTSKRTANRSQQKPIPSSLDSHRSHTSLASQPSGLLSPTPSQSNFPHSLISSVGSHPPTARNAHTSLSSRSGLHHTHTRGRPKQLTDVLALLRQEASFLSKSGTKPDTVAEVDEAILRALGIQADDDAALRVLVDHFTLPTGALVPPADVMQALSNFVQAMRETEEKEKEKEKENEKGRDSSAKMNTATLITTNGSMTVQLTDEVVKEFWERIGMVIPENVVAKWDKLEDELTKYNQLLRERSNLIQGNEDLKNQNGELKALLNQYLSSKINEELIVPPVSLPQQHQLQQQRKAAANRAASQQR